MNAIEITATIDTERRLILNEPLTVQGPARVRPIILVSDEGEIDETEWLRAAAANPALDFLKASEEDLHTPDDGSPFHDQR